jgi:hypothetical protein
MAVVWCGLHAVRAVGDTAGIECIALQVAAWVYLVAVSGALLLGCVLQHTGSRTAPGWHLQACGCITRCCCPLPDVPPTLRALQEMRESLRIVEQCLNEMPEGLYKTADQKIAPPSR